MPTKKPSPPLDRTAVIVAILSLLGTIIVGYWQFGPGTQTTTPITYSGYIINATTQKPIAGEKIKLSIAGRPAIETYTDSDGYYVFNLEIEEPVTGKIEIDGSGYQYYSKIISLSPEASTVGDIRLTPVIPTSTPKPPPTFTPSPSPTATITSTATLTPTTTATPLVVKAISDGCIFSQVWTTDSSNTVQKDNVTIKPDGCYDTGGLGVFANRAGILQIKDDAVRAQIASGIYTSINSDSIIEFKIRVKSMYIAVPGTIAYVTFAIAPANDPMTAKNTARFKLQVDSATQDHLIYFVLADINESNGARITTQHYEYGHTYTVRLELVGSVMDVYINNIKQNESPKIPIGAKVFYIGYNLPVSAAVDAEISNIKVDETNR